MKVRFWKWDCKVIFSKYQNGGTAIQLIDAEDGCPVATASIWLPGLQKDEIAIKDYSENAGMLDTLLEAEIITEPHKYIPSGHVMIPVCKLADTDTLQP